MIPGEKGCSHGKYWTLTVFFDGDDTDGTAENGKRKNAFKFRDYFLLFLLV